MYAILGSLVLLGYMLQLRKESKYYSTEKKNIDLTDLVVIIPFRNESSRIESLIDSINHLNTYPKSFLFINDHSTDNTVSKISRLYESIPYEILDLRDSIQGKKSAIQFGVKYLKADYNLTWDADISFSKNYFNQVERLPQKDLYILPVVMKGQNLPQLFYESDHAIANALNISLSGLFRPFLASGANLLFKQESYLNHHQLNKHIHIASGDDLFLLNDLRKSKRDILLITNQQLIVSTPSPSSFKEFIEQRLRWISKGNKVGDQLSNSLAILSLFFNLFFYSTYLYLACKELWLLLIFTFSCKTIIDQIVYAPYFIMIKRICTWLLLPIFSIIQPVYLLILLVLIFSYKISWKDRKIIS